MTGMTGMDLSSGQMIRPVSCPTDTHVSKSISTNKRLSSSNPVGNKDDDLSAGRPPLVIGDNPGTSRASTLASKRFFPTCGGRPHLLQLCIGRNLRRWHRPRRLPRRKSAVRCEVPTHAPRLVGAPSIIANQMRALGADCAGRVSPESPAVKGFTLS